MIPNPLTWLGLLDYIIIGAAVTLGSAILRGFLNGLKEFFSK